ncbi:hypothetical protein, partial [Burkholderia cenocepacia]|uniref:hypothetical protein n=1 Tax=Burkholderia cenocepacia TaxID=95486 RepID=UPI00406C15BD
MAAEAASDESVRGAACGAGQATCAGAGWLEAGGTWTCAAGDGAIGRVAPARRRRRTPKAREPGADGKGRHDAIDLGQLQDAGLV